MEIVWASYRSAEEGRKVVVCDNRVHPSQEKRSTFSSFKIG